MLHVHVFGNKHKLVKHLNESLRYVLVKYNEHMVEIKPELQRRKNTFHED
jgi:hypothetical protein